MPLILDYFIWNTTQNRKNISIGCQVNRNKHGRFMGTKEQSLMLIVPLSGEEITLLLIANW